MMPSRLLLGVASVALALGAASGCSDWPPGDRSDGGKDTPAPRDGFCGGTPRPCSGLTGEQCEDMPGCTDSGACSGSGVGCGTERSFSGCESLSNCFWSPACSGVPAGCLATTKGNCEAMAGCGWTPAGGGSGGAGSGGAGSGGAGSGGERPAPNCPSLDTVCTSSATCDCNMQCLQTCTSCPFTCAKACRTDNDCVDTGGKGIKTPYCVKFTETTTACSSNR